MRFKKQIREFQKDVDYKLTRIKSIEDIQAVSIVKTMCRKSYNNYIISGEHIQRYSSTASQTKYGILDASRMPDRLSRNTLNYYTQIINHDPIWKNYPRRQVIATYMETGQRIDTTNPTAFVIFPYDYTKVGICKSDDMWDSFPELTKLRLNARSYNQFINKLLNGGQAGKAYDSSLTEFKKRCKQFDKEVGGVKGIKDIQDYYISVGRNIVSKTLDTYNGDLYKNILHYYSPTGFKLGVGGGGPAKNYNEVWFDGPAVFVNMTEIDDFELIV